MTHVLGARSRAELNGVDPRLVAIAEDALADCPQDFAVHDGLRTAVEQAELVRRGASKTQKSKHLRQVSGFGEAMDLVPVINGKLRWEWDPIYEIAAAVCRAAKARNVPIVWGGVWDRPLTSIEPTPAAMKAAVAAYCLRHPGPDFIDGPHFQLGQP